MIAAALGWVGTLGTFGAYVLLSRGQWHPNSLRYAALNGIAGLLGAAGSTLYGAWPSVVSNLLWSAVAAHSIVGTSRERRAARTARSADLATDPEPATGDAAVPARAAWGRGAGSGEGLCDTEQRPEGPRRRATGPGRSLRDGARRGLRSRRHDAGRPRGRRGPGHNRKLVRRPAPTSTR